MKTGRISTVNLCYIGVMTAIAVILSFILKIPMAFFAPWLKMDLSFVPMMLTGFALGPWAGLAVLLITNIIHLFASNSGMVGQLADVLMGLCFLMPATLIYSRAHTRRGALIGMAAGTLCMIIGGILVNLYILFPLYFGADFAPKLAKMGFESVANVMLVAVAPFNLLKGVLVSAITFLLYKRLSKILRSAEKEEKQGKGK